MCNWLHLRGIWNATSILAMLPLLSKSAKRWMACIVGALVLPCQSVAVANACMPGLKPLAGGRVEQPCHESDQTSGQDKRGTSEIQCLSQRTAPADTKISVPAVADMPALTVRPGRLFLAVHAAPFPESLTARNEPPPLNILHCRLLI